MTSTFALEDVSDDCIAAFEEGRRVAGAERWLLQIHQSWEKPLAPVPVESIPKLQAMLYQLVLLPVKPTPAAFFFSLVNQQNAIFHHLLCRAAVNQLAEVPQDSADDSSLRDTGIRLLGQYLSSAASVLSSDLQAHIAGAFATALLGAQPRTAAVLSLLGALLQRDVANTAHVLKAIVPVLSEGKTAVVKALMNLLRTSVVAREGGHEALFTLCQHIMLRVPKKAKTDHRSAAARAALDAFLSIPLAERTAFVPRLARFLNTLSRNAADVSRAVAVETASGILSSAAEMSEEGDARKTLLSAALEVLAGRVADRAAAVRGKSLQLLASVLTTSDAVVEPLAVELMNSQGEKLCEAAEERMTEGSAAVRRGAVDLLAALLGHSAAPHTPAALRALLRASLDPSLLVRKSAMVAMDRVQAAHSRDEMLHKYWIALLLPRVTDPESTVQTQLLDLIRDRILRKPKESSLWAPLQAGLSEAPEVQRFFARVATMLAKSGGFRRADVAAIEEMHKASDTPSSLAAVLISAFAAHAPALVDAKFAVELACTVLEQKTWEQSDGYLCALLKTVDNLHTKLAPADLRRLHSLLVPPLVGLSLPAGLIAPFIASLLALRRSGAEEKGSWATQAAEQSDIEIARVALENGASSDRTVIAVWIAGELAAQQATRLPARTSTLLQALVASDAPVSVSAAAWLALGKLALADQRLAKKLIAPMAKELQTNSSAVVRNNVMLVLGDLAVQFPSLVDAYAPSLARCVRDTNETVRRQALCMLGRLVGQDYVKLRGPLLLAFAVALADESEVVRDTATETLEGLSATKKLPTLFFHSFLQIMLQINRLPLPGGELDASLACLSLPGEANAARREEVYEKLLSMLSDEQRLQLAARLHEEVLGVSPLDAAHMVLIADALALLQSPAAKVSRRVGAVGADGEAADEGEGGAPAGAEEAISEAKSALLGKVARKALVEAAVPVLASLKRELEQLHSPLLKPLLSYFAQLASENKAEMEYFLAENKQLERELQYEQRVAERAKAKRRLSGPLPARSPIPCRSPAKLRAGVAAGAPKSPARVSQLAQALERAAKEADAVMIEKENDANAAPATIVLSPRAASKGWNVALATSEPTDENASAATKSAPAKGRGKRASTVAAETPEAAEAPAKRGRGRPRRQQAT